MKAKELKIGYPIYHVNGHGSFGCDGDIVNSIETWRVGRLRIGFRNKYNGTYGCYYADDDDYVDLFPKHP